MWQIAHKRIRVDTARRQHNSSNSFVINIQGMAPTLQYPWRTASESWMGDAMTNFALNRWIMTAVLAATFGLRVTAQAPQQKRVIVVSLEDRKLALIEGGQVKKVYTVAVGKPSTPSPVGTFKIERRVSNPVYHHDGKTVLPGPGNPVGSRWMGLNLAGYGIHGTNEPRSIGKAASHGCIRMRKADLEEFYNLVSVGDTVELIGQRNEETAELFGGADSVVPEQPTVLAEAAPTQDPAAAATAKIDSTNPATSPVAAVR